MKLCTPPTGTAPGTRHVLRHRLGRANEEFFWTGEGWSTPGCPQWQTPHVAMAAIGWSYVEPARDAEKGGER